jgi:zinc protease
MPPASFRNFTIFIAAIIWLASAGTGHALTIETARLDNGLQIVVLPNHRAPIVTQMVWYRVGGIDEKLGKSGLSHMLEHMMFKGTPDMPAGKFSETIARAGGNENAFTTADFTAYFQTIAAEQLPLTLRLEADRMQNLQFVADEFTRERQVVIEERKSRTDNNPDAIWYEEMNAALYRNHPYGRPIIGWREDIENYTLEDLQNWYRQHYGPNNALLILAGDITLAQAQPMIEKYFGTIPPITTTRQIPSEPTQRTQRIVDYSDARVRQPQFLRLTMAPSRYQPPPGQATADWRASLRLELLAQILGGGRDGLLYKELVERQKLALSAGIGYDGVKSGYSSWSLSLVPNGKTKSEKLVAAADRYLESLAKSPLPKAVVERAKKQFIASFIFAQDSNFHLAYVAGEILHRYDDIRAGLEQLDSWDEAINAITPEQLQSDLQMILAEKNTVQGWLLPARSGD